MTKALQFHPNKPALWLEAASWELNGHGNEEAARKLLLQGLRICKDSKLLWTEYLKFEEARLSGSSPELWLKLKEIVKKKASKAGVEL